MHALLSRLVLAFLSGVLLALAFPKFNLFWLAWFAPGLMLLATRETSTKSVLISGYVAGVGNYSVLLSWLLLIPVRSDAVLGYLAVSAAIAGFIMIWCWTCWRLWPGSKNKETTVALQRQWQAMSKGQRVVWPLVFAIA